MEAQLYFYGYANKKETKIDEWWIINMFNWRMYMEFDMGIDHLRSTHLKFNYPPRKANFFIIPIQELKDKGNIILCSYENLLKYDSYTGEIKNWY